MVFSLSIERVKYDNGRRSSVAGQEYKISPSEFDIFSYTVKSANVGRAFNEYLVASLAIVNKIGMMATVSNLSSFLSMNFIWDLNVTLPHLDRDSYQLIREQYTWLRSVVSEAVVRLCRVLDEQLTDGQDIEAEVEKDLRSVRLLYEVLGVFNDENMLEIGMLNDWVTKAFVPVELLIGMDVMNVSHSAEALQQRLDAILTRWKLQDKIMMGTTDSATNMKAAMTGLSQTYPLVKFPCAAHLVQLCVNSALAEVGDADAVLTKCHELTHLMKQIGAFREAVKTQQQEADPTHKPLTF
ncbi:hypothetical protein BGZ97_008375, partial [Linnemannia gamsii]